MLMVAIKDDAVGPALRLLPPPAVHDPVQQIPLRWYVVQTHPQRERLVQSQLTLLGYEVFWPHNLIHKTNRRNRWRRLPDADIQQSYFSGYLFLGVRETQPLWAQNLMGMVGILSSSDDVPVPLRLPEEFMTSLLNAAVPGICPKCEDRKKRLRPIMGSCGLVGEIDDRPPMHTYLPGHVVRFDKSSPFFPHTARVVAVDKHGLVDVEADLFGRPTIFRGLHHTQLGEVIDTTSAVARPSDHLR